MTVGQIDMMPQSEFQEWIEFAQLEPFGLAVQDVIQANALAVHANLRRNEKVKPEPFRLEDFRLFSDHVEEKPKVEPLVEGLTAEQWRQRFAFEALAAVRNRPPVTQLGHEVEEDTEVMSPPE